MNYKLYFTLDYEIHGNGDGDPMALMVEPTYRLMSLLEKYGYTEDDAKQLCKQAGLLSPVYEFTDRGGCWFCPNAKLSELRHLYDHHPDLWQKMMRLQIVPGKVTEKFNRSQTFADIDAMFREQDLQAAA